VAPSWCTRRVSGVFGRKIHGCVKPTLSGFTLHITPTSVFFQFPDGARVESTSRQILSGWQHYFKELLKLQPGDINVATPFLKKNQFGVAFSDFQ